MDIVSSMNNIGFKQGTSDKKPKIKFQQHQPIDEVSEDKEELFYFIHPESGSAWIQDYKDDITLSDPMVEEIDASTFYYIVDKNEKDFNQVLNDLKFL